MSLEYELPGEIVGSLFGMLTGNRLEAEFKRTYANLKRIAEEAAAPPWPRIPPPDADVTRIEIRDPSLVVLVGAAGSGKSTFAARWFDPSEVLSSDAFREILTGDAADQRATKTAFSIIHREVTKRLAARRTVVVDATNVDASARRALISRGALCRRPGRRDRLRAAARRRPGTERRAQGRVVDPAIVERHLDRLEAALPTLPDEGFDRRDLRTSEAADTAEVRRSGLPS